MLAISTLRPFLRLGTRNLHLISCQTRHFAGIRVEQNSVYDALIVGAGPGGLTAAANLRDAGLTKICMYDPHFQGGRIHHHYREVPSNTKTGLFAQWATATQTFNNILEQTPAPNAYTRLLELDQDKTCMLSDAIDVAQLLLYGMLRLDGVQGTPGWYMRKLRRDEEANLWRWNMKDDHFAARKVVLAQGAAPRELKLPAQLKLKKLLLDTALKPSKLKEEVPPGSKIVVVGSSHSAVLAMKNLYELGQDISIVNLYRSPLLYAEYKDGWILYDNTGLKGVAADWAREVLEPEMDPRVRRVNLKDDARTEEEIYAAETTDCTYCVGAVGFERRQDPNVDMNGTNIKLEFDPLTGRFKNLPNMYGVGIAYPELVTDPAGNMESAVGWMKFMKFMKRVVPEWVADDGKLP